MKPQIVVVDDEPAVLKLIERILAVQAPEWQVVPFSDGDSAWRHLATRPVDAVISDLTMPGLSGIDLLQQMRSHETTRDIPVTMLTGHDDAALKCRVLDLGATDLLAKPFPPAALVARLRNMLRLKAAEDELRNRSRDLDAMVQKRTRQLQRSRLQIVSRLAKAGEWRDEATGEHAVRVAYYSQILGRSLGLSDAECEQLLFAAPLHDIGKIGISDLILMKPGRLTDVERVIVQTHCEIGERILREPNLTETCLHSAPSDLDENDEHDELLLVTARQIALSHHERWDGCGYPHRLKGTQIPLSVRIVSVAEVFDALTSVRPYKAALTIAESTQMIADGRGTQFDPLVVDAFLESSQQFLTVRQRVARMYWESRPSSVSDSIRGNAGFWERAASDSRAAASQSEDSKCHAAKNRANDCDDDWSGAVFVGFRRECPASEESEDRE